MQLYIKRMTDRWGLKYYKFNPTGRKMVVYYGNDKQLYLEHREKLFWKEWVPAESVVALPEQRTEIYKGDTLVHTSYCS